MKLKLHHCTSLDDSYKITDVSTSTMAENKQKIIIIKKEKMFRNPADVKRLQIFMFFIFIKWISKKRF